MLPACVAEGIGTFALVFAGCGAIMIDALSAGQVTPIGVGLVFGLVILDALLTSFLMFIILAVVTVTRAVLGSLTIF